MNRTQKIFFCFLAALFITSLESYSQGSVSASATGHVIAEVIPVFSATEMAEMNFGRFSPGPEGGEIILTPDGSVSVLGSIYKGTGAHNAATFSLSGESNASFTIILPEDPVVLRHVSDARTMTIENWMSSPGPGTGTGVLMDGSAVVYIGATLRIGSTEETPVGIYTGTYSISFAFN
jgi:hypothetical protein